MNYDDLLKLLRKRVSVRRFDEAEVGTAAITKLIKAGQRIITGCSVNPCQFQIIRNEQDRRQICDFWQEFYRDNFYIEQTRVDALRLPFLRQAETEPPFMNAPVFILATGNRAVYDKEKVAEAFYHNRGGAEVLYMHDMAIATYSLILAVTALGLGSLWVSVGRNWDANIKNLLHIPSQMDIHTLIAVGYLGYQPEGAKRRKLAEMVHWEKYDVNLHRSHENIISFLHSLRKITEPHYLQTKDQRSSRKKHDANSTKSFADYLNLLDNIYSNVAFAENPVHEEYITKVLEASRWTMSGANAQPWEFLVVQARDGIKKIFSSESDSTLQSETPNSFCSTGTDHFRKASAYILVLGDKRVFQATVLGASFLQTDGAGDAIYYKNMANVTLTIRLASASLGMITICKFASHRWEDSLKSAFNIPRLMDIHGIVALGFPEDR
ncbi:MAG: nitroreductase family protein [Dehalococcoidales bacterium]